jgi:hypothetical protein
MSKKTSLTIDIQTRICQLVNGGSPIPQACKAAGVSWNTAKVWLAKGREGKRPYVDFYNAVEQAQAAWVCASTLRVTKAGAKDWKASAWLLERRVESFRPPAKVEHTHDLAKDLKDAWMKHLEFIKSRVSPGAYKELIEATATVASTDRLSSGEE